MTNFVSGLLIDYRITLNIRTPYLLVPKFNRNDTLLAMNLLTKTETRPVLSSVKFSRWKWPSYKFTQISESAYWSQRTGKHKLRYCQVSILYKSKAGRYRPVRVADGPITARFRFIKNASWVWSTGFSLLTNDVLVYVYCWTIQTYR